MLAKKLSGFSIPTVVSALELSVESGWRGVFPEKGNGNGSRSFNQDGKFAFFPDDESRRELERFFEI